MHQSDAFIIWINAGYARPFSMCHNSWQISSMPTTNLVFVRLSLVNLKPN